MGHVACTEKKKMYAVLYSGKVKDRDYIEV